jgi:HSP20 family molecular chaperone IbpA
MEDLKIYEQGDDILVELDVGDLDENEIRVSLLDEQTLEIMGKREIRKELRNDDEGFYSSEESIGAFDDIVTLPTEVDESSIRKEVADGILTVILEKKR